MENKNEYKEQKNNNIRVIQMQCNSKSQHLCFMMRRFLSIDSDIVGCIISSSSVIITRDIARVSHIEILVDRFVTCYHDGVWVVNIFKNTDGGWLAFKYRWCLTEIASCINKSKRQWHPILCRKFILYHAVLFGTMLCYSLTFYVDVTFLYHCQDIYQTWLCIWIKRWVSYKKTLDVKHRSINLIRSRNCLIFTSTSILAGF